MKDKQDKILRKIIDHQIGVTSSGNQQPLLKLPVHQRVGRRQLRRVARKTLPSTSDALVRLRDAVSFSNIDLPGVHDLVHVRKGDEYKIAFRKRSSVVGIRGRVCRDL